MRPPTSSTTPSRSLFFAFAYLGGIASVSGAIAGGFLVAGGLVFTFLDSTFGVPTDFTLMLGGLALDRLRDPQPRRHRGRPPQRRAQRSRRASAAKTRTDPTATGGRRRRRGGADMSDCCAPPT